MFSPKYGKIQLHGSQKHSRGSLRHNVWQTRLGVQTQRIGWDQIAAYWSSDTTTTLKKSSMTKSRRCSRYSRLSNKSIHHTEALVKSSMTIRAGWLTREAAWALLTQLSRACSCKMKSRKQSSKMVQCQVITKFFLSSGMRWYGQNWEPANLKLLGVSTCS